MKRSGLDSLRQTAVVKPLRLNATVPLFGVIGAALAREERFTPRRLIGCAVGFMGLALLVRLGPVAVTPALVWGSKLVNAQLLFQGFGKDELLAVIVEEQEVHLARFPDLKPCAPQPLHLKDRGRFSWAPAGRSSSRKRVVLRDRPDAGLYVRAREAARSCDLPTRRQADCTGVGGLRVGGTCGVAGRSSQGDASLIEAPCPRQGRCQIEQPCVSSESRAPYLKGAVGRAIAPSAPLNEIRPLKGPDFIGIYWGG